MIRSANKDPAVRRRSRRCSSFLLGKRLWRATLIGANFVRRPNIILILRSVAKRSVSKDGNAKDGSAAIMSCIGTVPVATLRDTPLRSVPQGEAGVQPDSERVAIALWEGQVPLWVSAHRPRSQRRLALRRQPARTSHIVQYLTSFPDRGSAPRSRHSDQCDGHCIMGCAPWGDAICIRFRLRVERCPPCR